MMRSLLLVCLLFALAGVCLGANPFISVDNTTKFFVDPQGRVRLFHGVNAVYKEAPWHPELTGFDYENSLSAEDAKNLREWGFNVVRLGVEWPGVMPAKGQVNNTYLDAIETIVKTLSNEGIYSILDCHQDIFSRYYCGEGVPDWAVPKHDSLPFPLPARKERLPTDNSTGYPDINACLEVGFARYYFSGAVSSGFQHLYDNTDGLQDHFADYWKAVATRFQSNEWVLGFELINEPWAGDIYADPKLLLKTGYADQQNLAPMYTNLHNAIRTIDDQHIIFFEPAVSDLFHSGFTEGPGGPAYNDRQAYSYHVYCLADSNGDPVNLGFCNLTDTIFYKERVDDYHRIGVGGFMTEFGALLGTEDGVSSLDFVLGEADKNIQSWAYWSFKYFQDITTVSTTGAEAFYLSNGTLDEPKVKALSRTYAPSIAGVPSEHVFDPLSGNFTLTYDINESAAVQETQIYVNEQYYYPRGVNVRVDPTDKAKVDVSIHSVLVTHLAGASGTLTVRVFPN